jgi:hypothetical protein
MEINEISALEALRMKRKWKKLLNSRCRDLLEVDHSYDDERRSHLDGRVNFLHRTVSDFLRNNYPDELRRRAGEGFDARSSLCKTIIALSKTSADSVNRIDTENGIAIVPDFDLVDEMLLYAKDYERTEARSMAVLLDELDRVNTIGTGGSDVHWTNIRKNHLDKSDSCTFLALTIQAGLRQYVREKLEMNKMLTTHKRGRPLLDYACRPRMESTTHSQLGYNNVLDPQMVHLLLEHGADPNQAIGRFSDGHTIWGLFVLGCNTDRNSMPLNLWYECIEFMIDYGANSDTKVQTVNHSGKLKPLRAQRASYGARQSLIQGAITDLENERTMISVRTMLSSIFGADKAARLASRMEEVAQRNRPPPSVFWRILGWT